jgi:uncharacterized protein YcnI
MSLSSKELTMKTPDILRKSVLASAVAFFVALPAHGHVTIREPHAVAGRAHFVSLVVPTECAETTTRVRVQIPDLIAFVMPEAVRGWQVTTQKRKLAGNEENVHAISEIEWSGGAIPSGQYETFEFMVRVPAQVAGPLYFKTIQTCGGKDVRWIDVPKAREKGELSHPAPAVEVVPESRLKGPAS